MYVKFEILCMHALVCIFKFETTKLNVYFKRFLSTVNPKIYRDYTSASVFT